MSVGSYFKPSAGGGMISIQSSAADLQAFQDFAKVVPKAAAAAQRRAINKTLGWLRTHIARAVSKQERIAVAAVRQRLRSYPVNGGADERQAVVRVQRHRGQPDRPSAADRQPVCRWRGGVTRARFSSRSTATSPTSGSAPPASISTRTTTPTARSPPAGPSSGWIAENDNRFPLGQSQGLAGAGADRTSTAGSARPMSACWRSSSRNSTLNCRNT